MNVDLLPSTRRMIEDSPAGHEVRAFVEWLHAERYTDFVADRHARRLLFVLPRLCRGSSLAPALPESVLLTVFGQECRPRSRFHCFAATRRLFTQYLRKQGRLILGAPAPDAEAVDCYLRYLTEVRGLSESARGHHALTVRLLLARIRTSRRSLWALSRDDIEAFIRDRSKVISRHSLQNQVGHLRTFLRFARDACWVQERLDGLDTPRTYRGELPPQALPWPVVLQLLDSIDRNSRCGWRDLCILHLIAHYGLRPGEVAGLRLDAIDWRGSLLHVYQSKTRSALTLPLDARTCRLLRGYLRHGRPSGAGASPMLFVRARCPFIPLERTAVGDVFRKRMLAAGLPDCGKHVYRLRHTFAMRLLRQGVGIKAIGDVLGHRSFIGTSAYLRLDVDMLRGVALPVPTGKGGRHA